MPKNKPMAQKPPRITRLHKKFSLRIGPPPAFGKPVILGKSVAVGVLVGVDVGVDVGMDVGVDVGMDVGVDVGVMADAVWVAAIAVSEGAIVAAIEVNVGAITVCVAAMAVSWVAIAVWVAGGRVSVGVIAIAVNVGGIAVNVSTIAVWVAGRGVAGAVQTVEEMLLVSNVTAPFLARTRPGAIFAPVFRVMLVSARILPWNDEVVPKVAEVPSSQNTLQPEPPLVMRTVELLAVVSVLPILNTKTASALPRALSVSAPVNCADESKQ